MGREIKFRAWDKQAKRMIVDEQDFIPLKVTNKGVLRLEPGYAADLWAFVERDRFELMQYTGLKDKNGREIYEGDVLTSQEYPFQDEGKYNYHGVIEWIDEEASFYMTKRLANPEKRGMSNGISQPIESIEEFEVIGNIYENPELLEV